MSTSHNGHTTHIPRILYQCWDEALPDEIHTRNMAHLPGFEYRRVSLGEAREYLATRWQVEAVQVFDALRKPAHKVDLWRYCVLYDTGGVYLDADACLLHDIEDLIAQHDAIFVTNDRGVHDVYNGFLALCAGSEVLRDIIRFMLESAVATQDSYLFGCRELHRILVNHGILDESASQKTSFSVESKPLGSKVCVLCDTAASDGRFYARWQDALILVETNPLYPYKPYKPSKPRYNSHRLGNLLDAWYFGSLGSIDKTGELPNLMYMSETGSLGKAFALDATLRKAYTDEVCRALVEQSETEWATYKYDNVVTIWPHFQAAIWSVLDSYTHTALEPCKFDCVVHYRVGDFVSLGQCIAPEAILAAMAHLPPDINIGVINAGVNFFEPQWWSEQKPHDEIIRASRAALLRMYDMLRSRFANVTLFGDSVDQDFYTCATAPMLFTAAGSFAIAAAMANRHGIIRTPACVHLNFPQNGCRAGQTIHDRWCTYEYDRLLGKREGDADTFVARVAHVSDRPTSFTSICMLMYYDTGISEYADMNRDTNAQYCRRHGIDFHVSHTPIVANREHAWQKLPHVLRMLQTYEYVIWVDADALFYRDAADIRTLLPTDADFIFSRDYGNQDTNLGIFVVKASEFSRSFIDAWMDDLIYRENPKPFHWEQGVLDVMLDQDVLGIKQRCHHIDFGVLQSFDEVESLPRPLLLHAAGKEAGERLALAKKHFLFR